MRTSSLRGEFFANYITKVPGLREFAKFDGFYAKNNAPGGTESCYDKIVRLYVGGDPMIRIALCEDDAVQRRLMAELLDGYAAQKEQAVRVWVFSSGRELLASLYDELFDIYVLDIVMPHMDGIRLGSEIRKTDRRDCFAFFRKSCKKGTLLCAQQSSPIRTAACP